MSTHNLDKFGLLECATLSNLEKEKSRFIYSLLCQHTNFIIYFSRGVTRCDL